MSMWQSLTLGGIFPGPAESIANLAAEAEALAARYAVVLSQLNAKVDAVAGIVDVTADLAAGLAASGFYTLPLEPGLGGWADRINAAGGDAPPNDGASAGMLIVVQGVDVAAIAAQYAQLQGILASPIQVPR